MSDQREGLPAEWPSLPLSTPKVVNQVATQVTTRDDGSPEQVIVTFGYASPPILVGTPAEQQAILSQMSGIPVELAARIVVSEDIARKLVEILNKALDNWGSAAPTETDQSPDSPATERAGEAS